jgi:hypothetical protein
MNQTVNQAPLPQLLFVGDEIKLLEHLIDETPTKFGKQFLNLLAAVRQKRANEQRLAQEAYFRQQQEAQAEFLKNKRKRKKAEKSTNENTDARV